MRTELVIDGSYSQQTTKDYGVERCAEWTREKRRNTLTSAKALPLVEKTMVITTVWVHD